MSNLRTYRLQGKKYRAHPMCRDGFRSDREHGLIYGPYAERDQNGKLHFINSAEEASMRWHTCVHCGER